MACEGISAAAAATCLTCRFYAVAAQTRCIVTARHALTVPYWPSRPQGGSALPCALLDLVRQG